MKVSAKILKAAAVILLLVYVLSLVPVLSAARYARPVWDDYSYGSVLHNALVDPENYFYGKPLLAFLFGLLGTYFTWQGTYAAVIIFQLQPGIFSEDLYFLTTYLLIGMLTLSVFVLVRELVVNLLHEESAAAILLSAAMLIPMVHFLPDSFEAFYFFNGGTYYTLFFSFSLLFYASVLREVTAKDKNRFRTAVCVFLAILVGGGNYTTGLISCELLVLLCVYLRVRRGEKPTAAIKITVTLFVAFLINMIAPGNAVRAAVNTGMNPIRAIIWSILHAGNKALKWTRPELLLFAAITAPVLFGLAKKTDWQFRLPFLFSVISFGLFASQFTPALYAMSNIGGFRQIDIYFYSFYFLIAINLFYWGGWLQKSENPIANTARKLLTMKLLHIAAAALILTCAVLLVRSIPKTTGGWTLEALRDGSCASYVEQYDRMLEILNSEDRVVYVKDIENAPIFLKEMGLSIEDPKSWVNDIFANYFQKDAVYGLE